MKPTTEKGFRDKIRKAAKGCGTYKPEFEGLIARLAEIYVRMQLAKADYQKSGSHILIKQTNKSGAVVPVKNPLLVEIDSLSDMALEMEKELGLTPASLRKVNEAAMPQYRKQEEDDPLSAALGKLRIVS